MTRIMSWDGPLPEVGHYLRTAAGSLYAVIGVRLNARPEPKSLARLDLLKLDADEAVEVPADVIVHGFAWCSRR
jgi:hypothetical protein